MDDLTRQLHDAQTAVALLVAAVLIAIGYILSMPLPAWDDKSDPTCPLHKMPRSKCKPEWHE